ncbi:MAG: hypothetical protein Q7K26_01655 [bacterium]|nr:hypothetical protein [bacterium]
MYKELLLFPEVLKGQQIYPEDARSLVAKACDGRSIDPAIFARGPDGKTLQGRYGDDRKGEGFGLPPSIIFDGGNGFIRIYGIGKSGTDLLAEHTASIVTALSKHLGGPYRMEFKHGDCELQMSEPILYSIRKLIVSKKPAKLSHFFGVTAQERAPEIKKEILNGLISMARWLDEDLGTPHLLEHGIPSDDSLILDILEGESVPIPIKPGIPAAAFKNITFCTNISLNGPWMAGKLRSRGYGLIRRRIER